MNFENLLNRKRYVESSYRDLSLIIESCEEYHESKEQSTTLDKVKVLSLSAAVNTIGVPDPSSSDPNKTMCLSENTKNIIDIVYNLLDKASRQKKNSLLISNLKLSRECLQLFQALKMLSLSLDQNNKLLLSALAYNDYEYAIDCIYHISSEFTPNLQKNLQYLLYLDDLIQILRIDSKSIYSSIVDEYKKKVIDCTKFINLISIDTKYPEIEKKLDEALNHIKYIKNTCDGILPSKDLHAIIGTTFDYLLAHIISLIVKLEDICTEDTPLLKHLMWKVFECSNLFTPESPKEFTTNWQKLELLIDIFDSDLLGIVKMHQQHKFKDKFNLYEIRQLVKALYVESEQRAEGLKFLI